MHKIVRMAVTLLSLVVIGLLAGACNGSGLSASSTCQDFMHASPQEQQSVIDQLASQYDKPDFADPLGAPEVPYYCAANPNVTLGHFFTLASG